jgi:hypothetical protein
MSAAVPFQLPSNRQLAGWTAHAWAALTHACHYHPYELPPTAEELERWLDAVEAVITELTSGIDVGERAASALIRLRVVHPVARIGLRHSKETA